MEKDKTGGRRQVGMWGGRVAVEKTKGKGKMRPRGWELGVGMGELRSQPFSAYS